VNEWISVKDKLPKVRKSGFSAYVLTYHGGLRVREGRIRPGNEWRDAGEYPIRVTYWMPMLPLPREGSGHE